jgi:hypothetical protein
MSYPAISALPFPAVSIRKARSENGVEKAFFHKFINESDCRFHTSHTGLRSGFTKIGFLPQDRVGSSADPTLNGHLKYPNNLDQSLNDAAADKIREYR